LTQVDPQKLPLVHTQPPLVHTWPLVQAPPQLPQLAGSVSRLTQLVPHSVPLVHPHAPLAQTCPEGHARPQLPQLAGSVAVLTQLPLQPTRPDEQAQLPLEHV
jgi:hypothetical protein